MKASMGEATRKASCVQSRLGLMTSMQTWRGFGDGAADICAARGRPAEGSGDQRWQDNRGRFGDGKMSKRKGSSPGSKSLPGIRCAGGSWAEHRSKIEEHGVAA
jgi:hypothetical protein